MCVECLVHRIDHAYKCRIDVRQIVRICKCSDYPTRQVFHVCFDFYFSQAVEKVVLLELAIGIQIVSLSTFQIRLQQTINPLLDTFRNKVY